ncbi:hypothetical protein [Erwinia psidii]|uniref:Uncharacterized protein n=1 Tax=Erwinia psidii TaxID=69224 RepID=A0A3N6RWV7_9GAMM|nr:hypothetical protein [Erwinia psidii]RQM36837.1 hypothetical protein EB241_17870 [Erwinia psidii]
MNYGQRNRIQMYSTDADQAEFNALLDYNASIDSGIEDDRIAGSIQDEIDDLDGPQDEEWMIKDHGKDIIVGKIAEHIEWRSLLLEDYYPFEYKDNHLTLKDDPSIVYLFCLCISVFGDLTKGDNVKLPRKFELIAGELFTKFFSPNAKHMHTGWPRSDGNPTSYIELAQKLNKSISESTFEWKWRTEHGLTDNDAVKIKDSGVDFVSWIDFLDRRDGRLFALGQCACGNDWPTKFNDIKLKALQQWFHPLTYIDCVKVFSTPYILVDEMVKLASTEAGIVFDRIRMTIAYEKYKNDFLTLQDDIMELIEYCKAKKMNP